MQRNPKLVELEARIEELKQEAEVLRSEERATVIAQVREMVKTFEFKAKDLFGPAKLPDAYRDEAGNAWTGRGPQPQWLRSHVAAGRPLAQFRVLQ